MSDAVVLLSGGLDSYTAAAIARAEGFRLNALTVRYGQRHAKEVDAARAVAKWLDVARHVEVDVGLGVFGGSSLTTDAPVPKDRPIDPTEIPSTYVPARNTVFLALALGWAEVLGAHDIVIGVNALDYSGLSGLPARVHRGIRTVGLTGDGSRRPWRAVSYSRPTADDDQARHHHAWRRSGAGLRLDAQLLRPRPCRPMRTMRQLRPSRQRLC